MKVFVGFFVTLIFLSGFATQETFAKEETKTILVVPLDSRPVNTDVLQQVAKVSGINVMLPPGDMLGDLTTSGDIEKIKSWVLSHAKEADGFVLSTDMLAYGGLVASRTNMLNEQVALENLTLMKELKKEYPDKKLMVYSSLLRLAPTVEKQDDLTSYEQLRFWAIKMGEPDKNKKEIEELEKKMDSSVLKVYQATRHRNLSVNKALVDYAKNDVIDVLVFGQDDAASIGIHQAEKEELALLVEKETVQNVSFLSGIDEVGSMLVTRFILEEKNIKPSVYVVYDNLISPFWSSSFDAVPVAKNVDEHLTATAMKRVYFPFSADFYLYVNTPFPNIYPIPTSRVVVADIAVVNKSDSKFVEKLLSKVTLNDLYSYSGWNTAGNTIGLSLSFAGARLVSLEDGTKEQTLAHASLLYRSFLLDNGYKARLYSSLKEKVEEAGDDPYSLGEKATVYEEVLNKELKKESNNLFNSYFKDEKLLINQNQTEFVTLDNIDLPPATFPWKRLFEIRLSPEFQAK